MATDVPLSGARLARFTVGGWLVDPRTCRLSRDGVILRVRPQLIDLLACLARRPGELVLKEEILAEVWPGQHIAECGISRCIAELRQALQDDAQQPRYFEAIRKRGYRLIAPAVWLPPMVDDGEPGESGPMEGEDRATASPRAPSENAGRVPRVRRAWRWPALLVAAASVVVTVVFLTLSPGAVLTEQDMVLLAFENVTGDAAFDEIVPLAMSVELEQSPYLRLLSGDHVQETLRIMQRPPNTPLTRTVGLEVCERIGARALIVTSIASLGRRYVIGIEAVECNATQKVLVRRQEVIDAKEQLLDGLQRGAEAIRRAAGESPASLEQHRATVAEATTTSLESLRELRRGDVARDLGQGSVALDHYRQAVSLDPDCGLAHLRRGTAAYMRGAEAEAAEAFEKAYALRERVTLPERLEIDAWYYTFAANDEPRVIDALEQLVRRYPRRAAFRRSLADVYLRNGRLDEALAEALDARRLEPKSPSSLVALGRTYLYMNRIVEARQAAEEGLAAGDTGPWLHFILFQCGLVAEDAELLARERAWAALHPDLAVPYIAEGEAEESMSRGQLNAALGFLGRYEASAVAHEQPKRAAMVRLRMARYEALCGLRAEALRRIEDERQRGMDSALKVDAVKVAVSARDFRLAGQLLGELEQEGVPEMAEPFATFVHAYRAAVEAHEGRIAEALGRLIPLEPLDLGPSYGFIPLFERAQVHYRAGDWARARAAFEKILSHPTIDSGRKLVPVAQLGLARTLARAGDVAASRQAYALFFERWKHADANLPLLAEARAEYYALPR
jgi:DNA-binding winged helix-turn-helix (wHTH) protein/tetratricopeptide (TPR) repeat protein